ncbi:restriction endonuclease PLD domain-containing protein [Flavonifractor plautii]|uniref:restriction endonuclease PLD domain-containing protein n=1 Tax=Flavonifractor plautii TaxID=292800 RepID=UPI00189BFD21|nr:restriction endonuclease PLD domain-containing protein [Flavonifractor plautii]MDB7875417.1 NgoFVII family restriction endonuclease [Flavonifractor plautii]
MNLIYSDMLPVQLKDGQKSIVDCLKEQFAIASEVEIAVGYVSKASMLELDAWIEEMNIRRISLTIGMYYVEGMPESSYRTALSLNEKWMRKGLGEIRMVKAFKYHGKTYCFYKDGKAFAAVIGSSNLGVMKLEASNRRQFEAAAVTTEPAECSEIGELIKRVQAPNCSANIADITNMTLIREVNTSLNNIETVEQIPKTQVDLYEKYKTKISFTLPLKVPMFNERHMDDGKHYTKSNLNVCYAAPRSARKSRDWYETQLTVSKEITRMEGYPEKKKPFFVATDDGYWFKVHTTSDGNKQFSAVGNELIMGRWIKGRLAAAGLISPVNDTGSDTERRGMITQEMLDAYGCDQLVLTKTSQKALDENGEELDVWVFSFESSKREG